jgi:hypothetical protein
MSGDARALIECFYRAYNVQDSAGAASLYAVTGEHHDMATGSASIGRSEIQTDLGRFFGQFRELHWNYEWVAIGRAGHAARYYLTFQVAKQGVEKSIEVTGVHTFSLAGGLIVETRDFWNFQDLSTQLA